MENIKNLKKIGWTSLVVRKNNNFSCILVKKNLFKGFTVILSNGEKKKVDDLSFLNEYKIESENNQLFYNKQAFSNINNAFNIKNSIHENDVANLSNEMDTMKKNYEAIIDKLGKEFEEFKEQSIRNSENEKRSRISYLGNVSTKFGSYQLTEEGQEVVEKPINDLQRSIGRTCNIVLEPYTRKYEFSWEMDEYLTELHKLVDEPYKEAVLNLKRIYSSVNSKIGELKKNYDNESYTQTVSLILEFTNNFMQFIYDWRTNNGLNDVYYYNSETRYGSGDEKYSYTYKSSSMINQGEKVCERLIGLFYGEEKMHEFIEKIECLKNEKSSKQM